MCDASRLTSVSTPYECTEVLCINNRLVTGKLYMAMAPGRKDGKWNRDIDADLNAIHAVGINTIVCLLEWHEMQEMGVIDYVRKAKSRGFIFYHFPIRDLSCPNLSQSKTIIPKILNLLLRGNKILVHCREGLGRAGTICACCISALGYTPQKSIELVRKCRRGAIQTTQQELCIYNYA